MKTCAVAPPAHGAQLYRLSYEAPARSSRSRPHRPLLETAWLHVSAVCVCGVGDAPVNQRSTSEAYGTGLRCPSPPTHQVKRRRQRRARRERRGRGLFGCSSRHDAYLLFLLHGGEERAVRVEEGLQAGGAVHQCGRPAGRCQCVDPREGAHACVLAHFGTRLCVRRRRLECHHAQRRVPQIRRVRCRAVAAVQQAIGDAAANRLREGAGAVSRPGERHEAAYQPGVKSSVRVGRNQARNGRGSGARERQERQKKQRARGPRGADWRAGGPKQNCSAEPGAAVSRQLCDSVTSALLLISESRFSTHLEEREREKYRKKKKLTWNNSAWARPVRCQRFSAAE